MCRLTKLAHANLVPTSSRKPMDVDGTTPVNSAAASVFAKGQDDPRDNDHPKPSETVLGIGMRPPPRPFVPSRGDQETQKTKDTSPADLPRDAFFEVSSACEMNCFRLKDLKGICYPRKAFLRAEASKSAWVESLYCFGVLWCMWSGMDVGNYTNTNNLINSDIVPRSSWKTVLPVSFVLIWQFLSFVLET